MELFSIRPMEESDLDVVMYLEGVCFLAPWNLEQIRYELNESPVSNVWVIESSTSGVVGFVDCWIMFNFATIAQICVNPVYRRRGLGRMMLDEVIKDCKAHKMNNISLEVRTHNEAAIKMYLESGFVINHTKKAYYTNGDDAYYMIKYLRDDEKGER